jgi:ankyrin repeat protein
LQDGRTALHQACQRGYKDLVELLIDSDADVDKGDEVTINTFEGSGP